MTTRRAFALWLLLPFAAVHGGSATPPDATLAGTVTDGKGRPLADAEVRLEPQRTAPGKAAREDRPPEPSRRTRTDARGGFRFDGLCTGCDYAIRAARPGLAPEILPLATPRQGGILPALRIVLLPGQTAFGTVVDEVGQPAAGIAVELVRELATPFGGAHGEAGPYRAVTGPEGRFQIPDLPAGSFILGLARPGRPLTGIKSLQIFDTAGRTDLGRLEIPAGRTIAGRALDPQGKPLAGVEVWVVPPYDATLLATWDRDLEAGPQAVTGPNGRFEIPHVDSKANLTLCRTGYAPGTLSSSGDVTLTPPIRRPRYRIAGRVVTSTGEPVAGAVVLSRDLWWLDGIVVTVLSACQAEEAPKPPAAVSGPDGRFVLEIGPALLEKEGSGSWILQTQPAGFLEASQEVEYGPGKEPFVELVVRKGAVVTGRVFSPDGKPVADVEVLTEIKELRTVTGADGLFRFDGIEPGQIFLRATHPELGKAARRLDVGMGENRLDLTLNGKREREIRGRVLSLDGDPIPGVRVWAICPDCEETWSAGDGSFTLTPLRSPEVRAEKAGFAAWSLPLPPGNASVDGLEIRLERGIDLSGQVLDIEPPHRQLTEDEQKATLGAYLTARRADGEQRSLWADSDGSYRFEDLPSGSWKVTATALGRSQTEQAVLEPGIEKEVLDIRLPPDHEVSGRVVNANGDPVQATLRVFPPETEEFLPESTVLPPIRSSEDGSFTLWLPEGTYKLRASRFPLAPGVRTVVVDGPVSGLEIRIEEGTKLQGRLLGITPGYSTKVQVEGLSYSSAVAPDGSFGAIGLGPGTWKVTATHREPDATEWTAQVIIEIAPGTPEVVRDIDLATGDLVLTIQLLPGDEPLPLFSRLRLVRADGVEIRPGNPLLRGGASFRFSSLAPGRYRIEMTDFSGLNRLHAWEIELDRNQEMEIQMGKEP